MIPVHPSSGEFGASVRMTAAEVCPGGTCARMVYVHPSQRSPMLPGMCAGVQGAPPLVLSLMLPTCRVLLAREQSQRHLPSGDFGEGS